MAIHAYYEEYMPDAQRTLGQAFDFALDTLGMPVDLFTDVFLSSDVSKQIERGNPAFVAGKNGCEIVRLIIEQSGISWAHGPDEIWLDSSPEYWAGWAVAYYQWHSGLKFSTIFNACSLEDIIAMYTPFHEMDILHFVEAMDKKIQNAQSETKLKFFRQIAGFSQSELSRMSEVPTRQIQLFEQRQRDINKTGAETLLRLSRALHCQMEDLMELAALDS